MFSGTGTATVTTPAQYRPGEELLVTVTGPGGTTTERFEASRAGRLTVQLALGNGGHAVVTIRPYRRLRTPGGEPTTEDRSR